MSSSKYNPIPTDVLDKIASHRPHMQTLCDNYRAAIASNQNQVACQIGNQIAKAYLLGETQLTGLEIWQLSHHCGTNDGGYLGYGM